jgi:hypothetical protein
MEPFRLTGHAMPIPAALAATKPTTIRTATIVYVRNV